MAYQANVQNAHYSDIFNFAQPNNTDVSCKRQARNSNKSSDILSWNNTNPESTKPLRTSQNYQVSSVFSDEVPEKKTGKKYLAKESFVLGNEDTSSYNVKKDKTVTYDPNKYFKPMTAYERKINQFYGDDEKFKQPRPKGSITEKPSEKRAHGSNLSDLTARERSIQMLYSTDSTGKVPFEVRPAQRNLRNSTNTQYVEGRNTIHHQVESLKSNIFNDPDFEKRNNEVFAVKIVETEPTVEKRCLNAKKKKTEEGIVHAKLDWKDPKAALMRNQQNIDASAHDRKLNDLFGTTEGLPKHLPNPDVQMRSDYTNNYLNEHPTEREATIKKQMEGLSTILPREYQDSVKGKEAERTCQKYEISNFNNSTDVNIEHIEKVFRSKGVHIFGTNTDHSYHNGKTLGKITFSIRGNNNDNDYNNKLIEVCDTVKKETGFDITPALDKNKKSASNVPSNVSWTNASFNQLKKGKEDSAYQPKTHHKGPYGAEKISNTVINHSYKKK